MSISVATLKNTYHLISYLSNPETPKPTVNTIRFFSCFTGSYILPQLSFTRSKVSPGKNAFQGGKQRPAQSLR